MALDEDEVGDLTLVLLFSKLSVRVMLERKDEDIPAVSFCFGKSLYSKLLESKYEVEEEGEDEMPITELDMEAMSDE